MSGHRGADSSGTTLTAEQVEAALRTNERRLLSQKEAFQAALARRASAARTRASAERQAFLLTRSDALRPLVDPTEIQIEAARTASCTATTPTVCRAFAGRYPLEGFGARFFADLRTGHTVTVTDKEGIHDCR
jgi:hypothetical protein